MGARSFLRGLVHFIESAGATLQRRGGGASLTFQSNGGLTNGAAVGANAFAFGDNANASGAASAASGQNSFALGARSKVLGGLDNTAFGDNSTVQGEKARTRVYCERAACGGGFSPAGLAERQYGSFPLSGVTTDATPIVLTADGVPAVAGMGERFIPQDDEVLYFRAKICAVSVDMERAFVTEVKWAITNFGGSLAQLGSTNVSFSAATGATPWTAVPYVGNDTVSLTCTGEADVTVSWSVEVQYGNVMEDGFE